MITLAGTRDSIVTISVSVEPACTILDSLDVERKLKKRAVTCVNIEIRRVDKVVAQAKVTREVQRDLWQV